jgi:hypothetical protein
MLVMTFQEALHGLPAGSFIAVLQNGHDQGLFPLTAQRDQRGSPQLLVERGGRALQQSCWKVVELGQFRCGHGVREFA